MPLHLYEVDCIPMRGWHVAGIIKTSSVWTPRLSYPSVRPSATVTVEIRRGDVAGDHVVRAQARAAGYDPAGDIVRAHWPPAFHAAHSALRLSSQPFWRQ